MQSRERKACLRPFGEYLYLRENDWQSSGGKPLYRERRTGNTDRACESGKDSGIHESNRMPLLFNKGLLHALVYLCKLSFFRIQQQNRAIPLLSRTGSDPNRLEYLTDTAKSRGRQFSCSPAELSPLIIHQEGSNLWKKTFLASSAARRTTLKGTRSSQTVTESGAVPKTLFPTG